MLVTTQPLTLWLILRAFSSGSATLTGVKTVIATIDITSNDQWTDYVVSGLSSSSNKRPLVQINGEDYEVFQVENDDPSNPWVRLPCKLRQ